MADQWYYARGEHKRGPFSARQLKELAEAGDIRPADTVWKEGVAQGVPAAHVKHLFSQPVAGTPAPAAAAPKAQPPAPAPAPVPPAVTPSAHVESSSASLPGTESDADAGTAAAETTSPPQPPPWANQAAAPKAQTRPARAVAVRGAVITSQDGMTVHYRKKCTQCGYEDVARSRMLIRSGLTRVTFFCRKCRKVRQIEIQGIL